MKILIPVFSVMVLSGCVTTALPDAESVQVRSEHILAYGTLPSGPYGEIIVKRDSGMIGSACRIGFYVDGTLAGRIDTSEIAKFNVPVGERLIGIGPGASGLCSNTALREQSVIIKENEIRRYRISTDLASGIALTPSSR